LKLERFTTTGASILTAIEPLPRSILFWRSLTHWLGGMGIVVLTVAILPFLGVGGVHLVRAESPGPTLDKIAPKITQTAKILWFIYLGLTVLETVLLMFGGMDLFDALTHTFGTMATGGFSPRNASVGAYDSGFIDWVITVFMIMAGLNFGLYHKMLNGNIRDIFRNTEFKAYLGIFGIAVLIITISLLNVYGGFGRSLRYAGFQAASIITTTGYATADFDIWPMAAKGVCFS
jgi:trk system potassium uptake protein TrkH